MSKFILTLTPNESGQLVLSAEPAKPAFDDVPVLFVRPDWLDERVPFQGYCAQFTWDEMCDGSPEGGRRRVLEWAVARGPRQATRYQTPITEEEVKRAKACLAIIALQEAFEAIDGF